MLWFRDGADVCKDVGLSGTWRRALALCWSLCSLTGGKDFTGGGAQFHGQGWRNVNCSLLQTAISAHLFPGLRSLTTVR